MAIGGGKAGTTLSEPEVRRLVGEAAGTLDAGWRRVLVVIPDGTRSMPMPLMFSAIEEALGPRTSALDYLVALGTHRPMDEEALGRLLGTPVAQGRAGRSRVFNHEPENPEALVELGRIPAAEIAELTGGRLREEVPVRLNRRVLDYDGIIVCGPVFPHEVVGFSGGNKYFFPGIAGPEVINLTHWLGALISSYEVIGSGYTPVRAVIDRAAAMIPRSKACFALVVTHAGLTGLYFGEPHEAWQAAARLSAEVHVVRLERPLQRVLAVMPEMYEDLWTAAKGMYKLEPAVADGGEVVIYAPHLSEVSYVHGRQIDEIGYHCRDYFLAQWDRFRHYPGGVLAHSTHVRGLGSYDAATGVETPRIRVTLATGIPRERCERINLGYLDPASVRLEEWQGREAEGVRVVPRAGETLYRLMPGAATTTASRREP
jgi:nickel-dependent lactate racemase